MCEVMKIVDDGHIHKRHAGCGAVVGSRMYFWGGTTSILQSLRDEDDSDDDDDDDDDDFIRVVKTLPLPDDKEHPFDVLDLESLTWSRQVTSGQTEGDVPGIGNGSTLNYHKQTNTLYLFGGWNERQFSSDVFYVSLTSWEWKKAVHEEGDIVPSPRYLIGALIHKNKLCNFGGVGPDLGREQDVGSEYRPYITPDREYDFGWNNQYYEFDIELKKWEAPMSNTGKMRPPPVGGHVFTKIDKCRALYFGGRREDGRTDVSYMFDLEEKEFDGPLNLEIRPSHRTFATLCPLIDPDMVGVKLGPALPPLEQKMFLLWGKKGDSEIIPDCWLFDVEKEQWSQVVLNEDGRYWHMACSYFPTSEQSCECQVVVYGGAKQDHTTSSVSYVGQRGLTVLSFGVKTLKQLCASAVSSALLEHHGKSNCASADSILGKEVLPSMLKQMLFKSFVARSHKE